MLKKILDINQLKTSIFEQVLWAEKNLSGKSGAEKKAAIVKKFDDLIELPPSLEWADNIVISWLIDKVCDKLNSITGHNFGDLTLDENQERNLVKEIDDPKLKGES